MNNKEKNWFDCYYNACDCGECEFCINEELSEIMEEIRQEEKTAKVGTDLA